MKKTIDFKQFDEAVKAAYALGKMDGETTIRVQLEETRKLLKNMTVTNSELFKDLLRDHSEQKGILLSVTHLHGIITALQKAGDSGVFALKRKYEKKTGKKFVPKQRYKHKKKT